MASLRNIIVFCALVCAFTLSFADTRAEIRQCANDFRGDQQECKDNNPEGSNDRASCLSGSEAVLGACLSAALGKDVNVILVETRILRDKGKPETFSVDFNTALAGSYALILVNGAEGTDRLSSLDVMIDFHKVITPDCLNQNIEMVETIVVLSAGQHQLRARARSQPGGEALLTLILVDRPVLGADAAPCPNGKNK